jgi:hypothetical protein
MSACVQTIQLNIAYMQAMSLIDKVNRYYWDNISIALLNAAVGERSAYDFNCCLSVHVDNYTIIVPTKCTSLLKAQYITICTFLSMYS